MERYKSQRLRTLEKVNLRLREEVRIKELMLENQELQERLLVIDRKLSEAEGKENGEGDRKEVPLGEE